LNKTLREAEKCFAEQKWTKAAFKYLTVLKSCPAKREEVRDNFISTLRHWGEECEHHGRFGQILTCYRQGADAYPDSEIIASNLGAQLFRMGMLDQAASYFRRALRINPEFTQGKENLENVFSHLVERWHFRMLNDRHRNERFRVNISKYVKPGKTTVLDIGTGTGLLAMFAASAGAQEVHACEMSPIMYETAYDVLRANGMVNNAEDRLHVNLIPKKSTELVVGRDISEKVDLIVTETFDCGVLGEGVLSTMKHALKHLLKPGGMVLPSEVTIYVTAIECAAVRNQHRCIERIIKGTINCLFKVGPPYDNDAFTARYGNTDDLERYTTERLRDLPGGYRELSDPFQLETLVLGCPHDIDYWCEGCWKNFQLEVKTAGRLDALMMTFDLDLGHEPAELFSHPNASSCWEQAIFLVHPQHVVDVQPGTLISVKMNCEDMMFSLECFEIIRHSNLSENQVATTVPSALASRFSDLSVCTSDPSVRKLYEWAPVYFSSPEILMLNNLDTNETFCKGIEKFLTLMTARKLPLNLFFLPWGLTMLPLQAVKMGADAILLPQQDKFQLEVYTRLARVNDIALEKLLLKDQSMTLEMISDMIQTQRADALKWAGLIVDLVEPSGCLKQQVLEDIALVRMGCMVPGARVLPDVVTVYGMFIESPALMKDSGVVDDYASFDFKVAEFMNLFQMTTHQDIYLSTLNHRRLSEPFELFKLDLNCDLKTPEDIHDFLNISREITVHSLCPGQVHAIVYWFDMNLAGDTIISTLSPLFHWRQAAIIIKQNLLVSTG
ncbi:hypothetical protein CAPTEDRAFT_32873, partial [Capitella teleta]